MFFCCFLCTSSSSIAQSIETEEEIKHRFRNSLKKMKWDARKQRAIEKEKKPQKKPSVRNTDTLDTIRIRTDLVVNEVMVTDKRGNIVNGLKQADFFITENQAMETVEIFSPSNDPNRKVSVILILELSDHVKRRFAETLSAAQQLIDLLREQDRMAIVNDDIELLTPYTSNKGKLRNIISRYQEMLKFGQIWSPDGKVIGGEARQMDALMASLRELVEQESASSLIIFQTDGGQFAGLKDRVCGWWNYAKWYETVYSKNDLLEYLQRSPTRLYSIIVDSDFIAISEEEALKILERDIDSEEQETERRRKEKIPFCLAKTQEFMKQMAEVSGGWASYLNQPEPVKVVYERILTEARQRYILGYYPPNPNKDGKFREIKVTVKDHPEYIVRGRKGYFPRAE
jgi:Ca-activated chloride channel family protein